MTRTVPAFIACFGVLAVYGCSSAATDPEDASAVQEASRRCTRLHPCDAGVADAASSDGGGAAADAGTADTGSGSGSGDGGGGGGGGGTVSGWPGPGNTGVPAGTTLTPYTGSCTITSPVTIDAQAIACPGDLLIRAAGVVIKNSKITGHVVVDTDVNRTWSLTLTDSEVDASDGDLPAIYNGNVTIVRANIHGGHNGLECQEHSSFCSLRDSWIHDQWQSATGETHLGGVLVLGNVVPCTGTNGVCAELVHNTIVCDAAVNASGGGCTGDINLLPHYGPLPGAIVRDNFLGANVGAAYCTYGGAGMEYAASGIVYTGNVFQRGTNRNCAAYGPVTNFDSTARGNVWSNNVWDDGAPVPAAN